MFAGENAPVSCALVWCGWIVKPVDWKLDQSQDIASPQFQQSVRSQVREADAVMWAPQCDTLSRSRDIPIPGRSNPPQLIRSSGAVRGLPGLRPDLQHRVEQANSFVDFTWECIHEALPRNRAAAIESPACSWLWQFDQAKAAQLARTGRGTSTSNVLTGGLVRSTRPSKVMAREWRSLPRNATIRTQRASGRLTKLTYMPHKDPTIRAGCTQQRKKQSTPHPFAFISRSHLVCGQSEFEVSRWPYRGCPRSQRLVIGNAGQPYLSSCTDDG